MATEAVNGRPVWPSVARVITARVTIRSRRPSMHESRRSARVGETVMIVHSEANRDTRPHLIGGHGDYVCTGGCAAGVPPANLGFRLVIDVGSAGLRGFMANFASTLRKA